MRITLQQIEAFVWAARLGGVHAAARHLNLTQPAVSSRLRELESVLGIELFDRGNQRIELTHAGRHALIRAEQLLMRAVDMERQCKADPFEGLLRLGADESSALAGLADVLSTLRTIHPELQVEVTIDNGVVLGEKMLRQELDVAMYSFSEALSDPNIVDQNIGMVDFQWVAPASMSVHTETLTPSEAITHPIVTRPPSSTSHNMVRRWLQSRGYDLEAYSSCNSLALTLVLVEEGHGIALLPKSAISRSLAAGSVKCLAPEPPIPPASFGVRYQRSARSANLLRILKVIQSTLQSAGYFTDDALPQLHFPE